jgi:hypothetical protein
VFRRLRSRHERLSRPPAANRYSADHTSASPHPITGDFLLAGADVKGERSESAGRRRRPGRPRRRPNTSSRVRPRPGHRPAQAGPDHQRREDDHGEVAA